MFNLKRKKQKQNEPTDKNKTIEELQNQISIQEAQIITFKEDFAPQMAETIKTLKDEIERLDRKLKEKDEEIKKHKSKFKKIKAKSPLSKDEEAVELTKKYQKETEIYKNQVLQQSTVIIDLQKKVNLLPEICSRLMDEIHKRGTKIKNLSKELDDYKAENLRLSIDLVEMEKKLEENLKLLEDREVKTYKILNSIILR